MGGAPATVDVWVAPLDVAPSVLASLAASLDGHERDRLSRFRSTDDARRFAAAHGWLRRVLAAELGVDPAGVAFTARTGKPRLAGGAGPCFNLSRAGELALVAVAGREVGVDVERRAALEVVDLAFTPREAAWVRSLPPGDQPDAFLRLWTAKEAYLKATGSGLSVPPSTVEVALPADGAEPVPVAPNGAGRWWVRHLRPAPRYVAAVAAEGRDWAVQARRATDLVG